MEKCPPELGYINALKMAGIVLSLADYKGLTAINRDDFILWNEAEIQRTQDKMELDRLAAERHK